MSIRSYEITIQQYAKLEWAEEQIGKLADVWHSFRGENYPVASEVDPATRKHTFRLTDVPPIPRDVNLIAGDAIHNLRSALDHLLYRLVTIGTGSSGPFNSVYFPVGEKPKEFKDRIRAVRKCLKPPAAELLKEVEAYPTGRGNSIWELHRLNNIDKHRLLLTVTSRNRFRSASPQHVADVRRKFLGMENVPESSDNRLFQTETTPKIDLKVGDVLDVLDESEVQTEMYFPIEIAFGEPEIFKGNPEVIQTIQGMASAVRAVITTFDSADLLE